MQALSNLSRFRKQLLALLLDLFLLPAIFCFAIWLRYDGLHIGLLRQYQSLIIAAPLLAAPVFIRLGLYRAVIRFIDHKIVSVIMLGVAISVVAMAAVAAFFHVHELSRGVLVIYAVSAIVYVLASRFLARFLILRGADPDAEDAIPVLIYGAGKAGTQLAGALLAGQTYRPLAFVDDRRELQGAQIAGLRVYAPQDLPVLVKRKQIKEILLAMPSLSRAQQRKILDALEPLRLKTRVMPPLSSLLSGELQQLREIEIEDLLGRDPVAPDPQLLARCIQGKNVLVSGAGGSIGSELCRQILRQNPRRLVLLEMSEYALYQIQQELSKISAATELLPMLGSVLEQEKCLNIMRAFEIETVYHAAAYKHVPLVEHNPVAGVRNNTLGTLAIARAAMQAGVAAFVLISTDKAVRPTNVMGASKRLAELVLQAFARQQSQTRFCMVRFGNVLGSSGSVVPLFRRQIEQGGPLTVTHPEMTRYFMTIPEAAQLVLQAGAMGEGGDVFLLDMGEPVRILDMARRMVHLSGLQLKDENQSDGIEIVHVGLRPGEKLYEELLIGDNAEGTCHPLIMRAQEKEIAWPKLEQILEKLQYACNHADQNLLRQTLLEAVTEYTPQGEIEDFVWQVQKDKTLDIHPVNQLH
ncbi:nucleoside-diphosphate sugar epimerase/dehydratase [Massilia sp. W12]|uniref:polysaccharide biosynthesis protein n=1 Tax=Massilia sp. W12 TaxID=3126507 RepID=UPI0030CEBC6D